MDFSYTPEETAFRDELRAWLDARKAEGGISDHKPAGLDDAVAQGRAWQRTLFDGGWCGIHWPRSYGGRGAGLVEQIIFQEELARAGSPQLINLLALTLVGPVIIAHGTEAQKKRYLEPILNAKEIWCQGYSEPGAGSDLASLSTRAVRDGDHYVVNGQKVWTSYAQYADFCILLARTDLDVPKHKGITMLIVDMKQPGIEVRPLTQLNGDAEFNEVYFEDVRVPVENVVGGEGQGWAMAMALLMHERATLTFQRQLQSRVAMRDLLTFAQEFDTRGTRPADDPVWRQELARSWIDGEAMRLTALRHLTKQLKGNPPGPEGSMEKLFWSEMYQRTLMRAVGMCGAYSMLAPEDPRAPADGRWTHLMLYSRGRTIAAGTSEIQRGIIAQRVLGMPRDR
ncbi:MAG: alkylation response protein AidB-like acyl-CoA dehydrogenase [Hyphomicrobiaceae bacterium]|jgi:alkylation response protein AidB-like acyl-CoA dehydrogenase